MCGIVGVFWKNRPRDAERLLGDALDCLRLRGPNDRGSEIESTGGGTLAFGHTRLREYVLGGATRSLLNASGPALFLSH